MGKNKKVKNVISDTEKTNNEFKGISKAIDILSTQNTDLASTLDANMTDIKNSRLYRLINGVYDSVADFNTDNMDLGLTLYYQYVTILIVAVSSTKYFALLIREGTFVAAILSNLTTFAIIQIPHFLYFFKYFFTSVFQESFV